MGLFETQLFSISLRAILEGDVDGVSAIKTMNSIQDVLSYSGTVDGTNTTAVGQTFFVSGANFTPNRLKGFKLTIGTEEYIVRSNDAEYVYIESGTMSGLVGQAYTLELDMEDNELSGLALKLGQRRYRIISNTSNEIFIEAGNLLENEEVNYRVTSFNPKVEVTASDILLFKEYQNKDNYQLAKQISLRKELTFYKQAVDEINTMKFFEAQDLLGVKDDRLIVSLKKQSSEKIVTGEIVRAAKFSRFKNKNIKEGSVEFAESTVFLREVDEDVVSQQAGNYWIEYETGTVLSNLTPSGTRTVSYIWNDFPYIVKDSPVVINPLNDEDTEDFLFSQVEMKFYENFSEKFQPGQPTGDMIEYIAELLAVRPLNWGE